MENSLDDALRSLAVAIGIDSVAHGIVSGLVGQEALRFSVDDVLVRADEAYCSGFDGFRPFGRIAQDQDGLAQGRRFFLDAAGVGEDQAESPEDANKAYNSR